ncbi:hypothetical protein Ahy_A01g004803 isoform C [Arachis hypogaea]|uniref:Uncharacterized protein n=1 Tax=Arachis hypogaea TaxID=3818 RepID=A0A445EX53_ARAHY|nr:hypothetical protein Ahy_A01g004803 isoform C [Arachis hypogaea]
MIKDNTFYCIFQRIQIKIPSIASIPVPSSNCYTFDNSSRIEGTDLAVRFCKDVESRSQTGYVDFGRFDKYNYFVAGSHESDFVQEFYNGDLMGCEQSYDKMGRTAQVNIICGSCLNGQCKGRPGCICNVTYESNCRVSVELALPCEKPGPQVFQGFTVGFHPRSWEIVYNGMTQFGFEKPNRDFSFDAGQSQVVLFMTAVASHSSLVGKPSLKVLPEKGLEIRLSGSANHGKPPTTLSPTMLITIHRKKVKMPEKDGQYLGFFVSSTLFCCGGFIYKTKVERQRGIDALPGMTILSACLETISGAGQSYMRPEEQNSAFGGEASWERPPPSSSQGVWRQAERRYGSI